MASTTMAANVCSCWDVVYTRRFLSFAGHVARLDDSHWSAHVLSYRTLDEWRFELTLNRDQRRDWRHRGKGVVICNYEQRLAAISDRIIASESYTAVMSFCDRHELPYPLCWRDFAGCRELWQGLFLT